MFLQKVLSDVETGLRRRHATASCPYLSSYLCKLFLLLGRAEPALGGDVAGDAAGEEEEGWRQRRLMCKDHTLHHLHRASEDEKLYLPLYYYHYYYYHGHSSRHDLCRSWV